MDPYYDVEADEEVCGLGKTVFATVCLYLTFVAMGFGTGWSSNDSIFQELNKFIERYDDLQFASDLVFASCARRRWCSCWRSSGCTATCRGTTCGRWDSSKGR